MGGQARAFPSTRWTLILSSREQTGAKQVALQELIQTYWKPLYFYVRRKGRDSEAAKDVIQGFFLHLLQHDFLSRLDPGKGHLRGYLKRGIDHFLVNLHERETAQKRGGDLAKVSLDFEVAERGMRDLPERPDAAFDREWATGIMERAMGMLRAEFGDGKRRGPFELVEQFFQFGEAPSYRDAANKYDMTPAQVKAFLHRARSRFRDLLRGEVAHTVATPEEVEQEIGDLLRLLSA